MAILRGRGTEFLVPARCLIGRSALAELRIQSARASSEHASLAWHRERWWLRDLSSSNGTSIDGRALSARDRIPLSPGQHLGFGGEEVWTVVDVAPPEPCAILVGAGEYSWGRQNLLLIPSAESPEASAFANDAGWQLDTGSEVSTAVSGEVLRLPSGYWRLHLPDRLPTPNGLTASNELDLRQLQLCFLVSAERVAVILEQGATRRQLPARACLYTLLALARLRMAQPSSPNAGWISSIELAELRGCSPEKMNVDVHRLRRLFQDAEVHDAAQIIERDDAKKLRIGVSSLREARD